MVFYLSILVIRKPGPEIMKAEYNLKLKIKLNNWLSGKQPIIVPYFEFENERKFYNLKACFLNLQSVKAHAQLLSYCN